MIKAMKLSRFFCALKTLRGWLFGVLAILALPPVSATSAETLVRLPDGETTVLGGYRTYLIDPTNRYDHGVLGDRIEAGGFVVEKGSRRFVYRLPDDAVFEDLRVRIYDLDGDDVPEMIVIKSYLQRGSTIAIYRLQGDAIVPVAESAATSLAQYPRCRKTD
jgi:hypothetical protein